MSLALQRREVLAMSQELVAKRLRRPGGEMCSPPLVPALRAWIHPTHDRTFCGGMSRSLRETGLLRDIMIPLTLPHFVQRFMPP